MRKRFSCFLLLNVIISINTFSQTDYKTSTKNKDGFTSIYRTTYKTAASVYQTSSSETRYGLLDEKTQKIVLPIKYKMAYTSYEDGLYIVQDTFENVGLFSAKNNKFLIEPKYNKIETFSEGLAVVQKKVLNGSYYDYYYGAIDNAGKLIIADTFTYLGNCRDGLLSFKQDKKYGYLDKQGKTVIPAMYASAEYFSSGMAPVQLRDGDKFGYINKDNKYVIEPKYVFAEGFYQGYATVYYEKQFYGSRGGNVNKNKITVIDKNGKELTEPIYESVSLRREGGIFKVSKDEKYGVIDSTGKVLLPVDNKDIGEFYGGTARVEKTVGMFGLVNNKGKWLLPADYTEISMLYSDGGYYAKKDGKYMVYDKSMKLIIAADTAKRVIINKKNIAFIFNNGVKVFDVLGKSIRTIKQDNVDIYGTAFFSNDDSLKVPYFKAIALYNLPTKASQKLAASEVSDFNEEGIFLAKDSKYFFYDYTGKKLFNKSFENVVNFSDGICGLQETMYSKPYLADKSLNKIAELGVVFYGPYSEGLALAKSGYSGTLYYLDKKGNTQFYVYGKEGGVCKNNRIKIKNDLGKFYYVNKYGKIINNSTYDDLGDFADGLAGFKNNYKCGYIDTSGNVVIAATFDEVSSFSNGTAIVKSGNEFYQIDKTGKPINNNKYIGATDPANGTFPVKKSIGFGLIDTKGNTLVDFKYENITSMSENMCWAQKDKKWAILNSNGNEITAFEYEGGTAYDNGFAQVVKNGKVGLVDKTGKLLLSVEFGQMSKVYKNNIITVKPNGTGTYGIK